MISPTTSSTRTATPCPYPTLRRPHELVHPVRVHELGVDGAGAHGVHRDARRAELGSHHLREQDHAGLRSAVGPEHREALLAGLRSEEHTSELPSLMRISYAVLCMQKKN